MKLDTTCHVMCYACNKIIGIRHFRADFEDFKDHSYKDIECTKCFVKRDIEARKK